MKKGIIIRKITALGLAGILVSGMLPADIYAMTPDDVIFISEGKNTASDDTEIPDMGNIAETAENVEYEGKFFSLINDIDLSAVCGDDIEGISVSWEPIGAYSGVSFGGTFDGKNHRITNIKKICKTIREESYENR